MKIKDIVALTASKIKENPYFADEKITVSYPYSLKPDSPRSAVIAVGLFDMDSKAQSLGQEHQAGSVRVYCDCFFPYSFEPEGRQTVMSEVCTSVLEMGATGVYAAEPYTDKTARCVVRRLIFTFYGETDFN